MALYARLVDGPHEHPNGILLVLLVDQAGLPDRYLCQVVQVLQTFSRTSKVGDHIEVDRKSLTLTWVA